MDIRVNTDDIEHAGQQMRAKAGEMEDAVQNAENAISPLREMVSQRISRDLEVWDNLRQNFSTALQNLLEASDELLSAARDNEAANQ
jgi:uncharacterized protein YukE